MEFAGSIKGDGRQFCSLITKKNILSFWVPKNPSFFPNYFKEIAAEHPYFTIKNHADHSK